jgi:hypothetical protein
MHDRRAQGPQAFPPVFGEKPRKVRFFTILPLWLDLDLIEKIHFDSTNKELAFKTIKCYETMIIAA